MQFVSISQISETLIKWIKLEIGVRTVSIVISSWFLYDLYNLPEGYNPEIDLLTSELWLGLLSLVEIIVAIVSLILLLRWVYQLTKNLSHKHNISLSNSPKWAVGYFFIPILNLYKPYLHLKEMWHSMNTKKVSHDLLKYWWGVFLLSIYTGNAILRESIDNWSAASTTFDIQIFIASEIVDLVLAILTIALVKKFYDTYKTRFGQ